MNISLTYKTITILSFLVFYSLSTQAQFENPFKQGEIFQLSDLETMNGAKYSIDSLDSKILVMNFWNIGCKGCIQEMEFLNEVYDQFNSDSISFWSVTMSPEESLEEYLKKHPIKWEIKGDVDFMGITGNPDLNIRCMPTTIVLNRAKEILYSQCHAILEEKGGPEFIELLRQEESK